MVNQPGSIRTDDQLDELLDAYELEWSGDSKYLESFLAKHPYLGSPENIAELVRVDIDRRYAAGLDVDLGDYLAKFPVLTVDSRITQAIAFEDFRSRRSRGLSLSPKRWSGIPGIEQAAWFVSISGSLCGAPSRTNRSSVESSSFTDIAKRCNDPSVLVQSNWTGNRGPSVGEQFGEFQLLAILGTGAFSTVFLATQPGLASRYVALKVVRRLLDEPTHLARLQHTGIVPLYSLHRIGDYSALCMPYFGSATLADWLGNRESLVRDGQSLVGTVQSAQMRITQIHHLDDDASQASEDLGQDLERIRVWNAAGAQPLDKLRTLDSKKFVLWFAQRLAAALAHAHERGVIHGDLKPANVLLRNDGEPALIDFNLSKSFQRAADTWAGGTLPYMAPEQLQVLLGQTTQIDASADVYALGIMLFELLEGQPPFPRPLSQAASDLKIALDNRGQLAPMKSNAATYGMKAIICKCLSPRPGDRYGSGMQLLEDIELEIANQPLVHAKEQLFGSRLPKLIRRYPRLFSTGPVALVSLLALAFLGTLAFIGWHRSQVLAAESRVDRFQTASRLLLAEMIEPAPGQVERLISEARNVASILTANSSHKNSDVAAAADNLHAKASPIGETTVWLNREEGQRVEKHFVQFCLAAVALTCSSGSDLGDPQREALKSLLSLSADLSGSSDPQLMLAGLKQILQNGGPRTQSNYELMMRDLEPQFDADSTIDQSDSLIELLQARSDVRQGQARQAMGRLRFIETLEILKNHSYLYWMVSGDAQSQLAQPEAAIQAYGLAIGAAPKSVAAYVKRAQEFQGLRDYKAAEADYSRAISVAPATASLFMRRALVREELGDYAGAIKDMDSAIQLEPDSNRMLFVRARLHQLANHRTEYIQDFKSGMLTTPTDIEDWVSRALAQLPRYPEKAKKDLQEAMRIDPNSVVALQNLAHVESEHLQNADAAMQALDQILKLYPENQAALAGRSVLLARAGQVEDCVRDLDALSKLEQRLLPSTMYQMGCAHALISTKHSPSLQASVRLLAQALRRGYGADVMASDPDLDLLRGDTDFMALTATLKFFQAD